MKTCSLFKSIGGVELDGKPLTIASIFKHLGSYVKENSGIDAEEVHKN